MKKGLNSYGPKQRREIRRRNHIARDLGSTKYRQRVKGGRSKQPPPFDFDWDENIMYVDDGDIMYDD